jgi:ATP-dependent Clp protease adaptor protein ClpS
MPEPEPPLYSVSLLNDDKTPMQFVVDVLETFFNMDRDSATQKMFFIHHHGTAVWGFMSTR